ncbi:deoxyribose-phosphate aldolase [Parafrankia irregularis]|uniref:Deoxyribose-phosphate aldolase n=1 Tax=Parafrankia irregularis TaxID=795642 RepID=A0A0S4QG85_9ACTN|nr:MULTISPECIES: deoxyribose-phosphate aldolase [Parafrankia]MBE3202921.1 deoxyribose-phosphate aldolase [Parafrankia sp. CH37]CUU54451.1 deoxyribose-phosphate aldolase [Parafrankia irregularis]
MPGMPTDPTVPDRPASGDDTATPPAALRRADLAKIIDHTLLRPETTGEEIVNLCTDAAKLGVGTVCVAPTHVYLAAASARQAGKDDEPSFAVASVVGFPHGTGLTVIKAEEARRAVADGATEIDMVIDIANAMDENWRAIETEITEVRLSVPPHVILKVILETALLPDECIAAACRAAESGGAEYVKTSTGFHPAGGASLRAVRAMVAAVGGRLGVKASGGIRTAPQALAFLDAGATRLGLSATKDILADIPV